jgi:DNA polymerase-3 subunit delta'
MGSSAEIEESRILQPRLAAALFGHAEAERMLLDAYRSGRIPHAWLIGGERGIGKATLAYRLARFVLAHPDPSAPAVRQATSLAVAPDHSVARRIAAQAHPDLLVVRRVINEKSERLYTEIRVEDVRRSVSFFGSTAGAGGWRVAIVDTVDELNQAGLNALLKVVEEPPPRALLLLLSHAPGRVIATIRSRCRMLRLRPLSVEDVARAAAAALDAAEKDSDIQAAAAAAEGSVGRALMLLEGEALKLRSLVLEQLDRLPAVDPRALHALGDAIAGTEVETLQAFMDTINAWLGAQLDRDRNNDTARLNRMAEAWEAINRAGREVDTYNLDRRPFVFSVFHALAEAGRP